jgi:hypothetical protein
MHIDIGCGTHSRRRLLTRAQLHRSRALYSSRTRDIRKTPQNRKNKRYRKHASLSILFNPRHALSSGRRTTHLRADHTRLHACVVLASSAVLCRALQSSALSYSPETGPLFRRDHEIDGMDEMGCSLSTGSISVGLSSYIITITLGEYYELNDG